MIEARISTKKNTLGEKIWLKLLPSIDHDIVIENKSYKVIEITHLIEPHHSVHLLVKEN